MRELKSKKTINIIILLVILISLTIATNIFVKPFSKAEETGIQAETSSAFSGGSGTTEDPYVIENVNDLKDLATKVNSKTADPNGGYYKTKSYILKSDIDLKGEEWTPIGYYDSLELVDCTTNYSFQGEFNGNGYTIKNLTYPITKTPLKRGCYGIFGMLWGDENGYANIYNLTVDSANIPFIAAGSTGNEISIGIIAGHLGKGARITNCIVKNSKISVSSAYTVMETKKMSLGGIAGDTSANASKDSSGWSKFPTDNYGIRNCYADVDITAEDSGWPESTGSEDRWNEKIYYARYCIGGIVGTLCQVHIFPENCVYTGTISSTKAFVGPILGKGEFASIARWNYGKLFLSVGTEGKDPGNNYFYNAKIADTAEGTTVPLDSTFLVDANKITDSGVTGYHLSSDETNMKYVQGVNIGAYQNDKDVITSNFNNSVEKLNQAENVKYIDWTYDTQNGFKLKENAKVSITQENYIFTANVTNTNLSEDELTYTWYLDGKEIEGESGKQVKLPQSLENRQLKVEVYEKATNTRIVATLITIPKETIEIKLETKKVNNNKILYANIVTSNGEKEDAFTYKWYKKAKEEKEFTEITGATSFEYNYTKLGEDERIKLIVTSKTFPDFVKEFEYVNNERIYVDQNAGNDTNDGKSKEEPVKTLEQAYRLLNNERQAENNIIIIIGAYNQGFSQEPLLQSSTVFTKPATICGKDSDVDYKGSLKLMNHSYLNANTILRDITLTTSTDTFLYAQENDLTLEETVVLDSSFSMGETTAGHWAVKDIDGWQNLKKLMIVGGTKNYSRNSFGELKSRVCNITVKCSGIAVITGGARTQGYLYPDVYGTAEKPANTNITIDIPDNGTGKLDVGVVVGGQCDSSAYINSTLNINSGRIARIVGGTLGYGNEIKTNVPRDSYYGSSVINVNGGTVKEIYGGSLGKNAPTSYMYGKVEMNINGGTIETNIYGAGAGGTLGYSELLSDTFKNDENYGVVKNRTGRYNAKD